MKYTDNEMSIILLCSYIGVGPDFDAKPLSLGEWNKFYDALVEAKMEPKIIYEDSNENIKKLGYDDEFATRIKKLADRGAAVGFELQDYEKKGIYVTTEISKDYPVLLRRELKKKKPPVLYYAGDINLAKKVGIGVVGSRNVSLEGMEFTKELVLKATKEGMVIYSGGAKGVDTASETVALNAGGAVVSYIADSLVSKIKNTNVASSIAMGKMLLLSDQKPDMGFSAGRAMNRNKLIYASATGTFVIESDYNKGGTWTGATEAMKNNWGKVFVWNNSLDGNMKLIEAGGVAYTLSDDSLFETINNAKKAGEGSKPEEPTFEQMDLSMFLGI